MNIDMRNIPEDFEKNIREIMINKNIASASKALVFALEERKYLLLEKNVLNNRIDILKNKIQKLEELKDSLIIFKDTLSRV